MALTRLIEVEQAAERLTTRSVLHLAADDPVAASGDLTQALGLYRTPFTELLLRFTEKTAAQRPRPVSGAAGSRPDQGSPQL